MMRAPMSPGLAAAATGVALLAAAPAFATGGEPAKLRGASSVSGVTVTAKKPNPAVDPTTQFVRQHLPQSTFSEQFPRFRDDICVKVLGLPPEYAGFIEKRVLEVAGEVHAPVAKSETCAPNIHVVFTPKPQALISDIANHKDILLGFYWNNNGLKRLATFKGAIGAWYVTATRDQFGENRLEIHLTPPPS